MESASSGHDVHTQRLGGAVPATDAPIPEWVLRRVDDAITEHFFKMEATIEQFNKKFAEQLEFSRSQHGKVQEVFTQMMTLVRITSEEQLKGKERDRQLADLRDQLQGKAAQKAAASGMSDDPSIQDNSALETLKLRLQQAERRMDEVTQISAKAQAKVEVISKDMVTLREELECMIKRIHVQHLSSCLFCYAAFDMADDKRHRSQEELRTKLAREKKLLAQLEQLTGRGGGDPEIRKGIDRMQKELDEEFAGGDPFAPGALDAYVQRPSVQKEEAKRPWWANFELKGMQ